MGDVGEAFKEWNEAKKQQHREWHDSNRRIIDQSKIPYTDKWEALLFREPGMPKVDFYPSTGRWRVAGKKKTFRGGATAFLGWYRKQYQS